MATRRFAMATRSGKSSRLNRSLYILCRNQIVARLPNPRFVSKQ
jgi:hypothetical protein